MANTVRSVDSVPRHAREGGTSPFFLRVNQVRPVLYAVRG